MLKIKDDVDLKELEKFGFEENMHKQYIKSRDIKYGKLYTVYITPTHHYIQVKLYSGGIIAGSFQDLLYDLIKADLVEKVSDGNE